MKKLLSVFLACIMLACMLPTFAFAEGECNLWVGGVGVIGTTADITGDGTVSYDADNNMLTLNGATITHTGGGSGIYYSGTNPLTIKLVGTNSVTSDTYGIFSTVAVKLTGTGSLVVTGSTQATYRAPTTTTYTSITASTNENGNAPVAYAAASNGNYKYLNIRGSFTLTKEVVAAEGYDNAGATISDFNTLVSGISPEFTITGFASFNRQEGKTDIPAFSSNTYTIPLSEGVSAINIDTPDYTAAGVGDYWYEVTEQAIDDVAGLAIDTTATRYLHVQVVWDETAPSFTTLKVATVTLHNTAPENTGTYTNESGDKSTGFTNTYAAGKLEITKKVTGNMGDPNKLFKVTVTFTAPTDKTVMSPISYVGGFAEENDNIAYTNEEPGKIEVSGWTENTVDSTVNATAVVYLKNGSTVTFSNIPEDVTYKIEEIAYTGDGYTTKYAVDSIETESDDKVKTETDVEGNTKYINVTGSISDSLDKVTITNNKQVAIDVGVTLDNAPFVLLLIGSIAFLALCFVLKRRKEEAC